MKNSYKYEGKIDYNFEINSKILYSRFLKFCIFLDSKKVSKWIEFIVYWIYRYRYLLYMKWGELFLIERRSVETSSYWFSCFSNTISCGRSGRPSSSRSLGRARTTTSSPIISRNISIMKLKHWFKSKLSIETGFSPLSFQIWKASNLIH